MTGMRQTIQCSLALTPAHQGEARVTGYQGAESVVAKPAPERPALTEQVHVPDQAYPSRTAGYVTRMPGGVGGVAPRGVPLSRSVPRCGRLVEGASSAWDSPLSAHCSSPLPSATLDKDELPDLACHVSRLPSFTTSGEG